MPKRRIKRHLVTQPSDPSYRLIPLTQGQNALVDTEDFEWLDQWNWFVMWAPKIKSFYAIRTTGDGRVWMHREILNCQAGKVGDHINHNTLDNRRGNLRQCSKGENGKNRSNASNNSSGFKGVWRVRISRWRALIRPNGRRIHLGYFNSPEEAARAYDEAAKVHFGEFAHLNFPSVLS